MKWVHESAIFFLSWKNTLLNEITSEVVAQRCSVKKGVLKSFPKFLENNLCLSLSLRDKFESAPSRMYKEDST